MSESMTIGAPGEKKSFFKMACLLAFPLVVQNLINTLVSSADTVMLGYVSQDAMSASSLANQLQFILMMALGGLATGASVLAAQYWGRNDKATIERVMGLAMRISFAVAAVFFIAAECFPRLVMLCFTNEENIIKEGITYLRIIGFSYLFMAVSNIYVAVIRSVEKVVLPTVTYVVSLLVNITLNATFIFGLFGAPKLGLVGVAIGTVTARVVEMLICMAHSHFISDVKFRVSTLFRHAGILMKDFLHVSLPSMANDVVWSLAATMYSVAMGHLGSDVVAANAVAAMALNIGAMVARGFCSATTIIVSKPLGAGDPDKAKLYGSRMLKLTIMFGMMGMVVIWLIIPVLRAVYAGKLTETALDLLKGMMFMRGVQLVGENINTCLICGCFRGGGDARFGMILDTVYMWCVQVPLVLIAAFVLKLPTLWVYFVICFDEYGKMAPAVIHYLKFGWLTNITRSGDELAG